MSPLRTCHPSPSLSLSLCRAGSHLRVPNARPGESARLSFKFSIFDLFDAEIASSTLKVTLLNSQRVAFAMLFSDFRAIQFPECCLFRNRKGRNDTFPFLPRNFLRTRRIFGNRSENQRRTSVLGFEENRSGGGGGDTAKTQKTRREGE